ncbi:MAG: AAA family ATPase, partial [Lachnospiraceae bacterium]|nr:AAA family ATPase [Lachnospiraceae bacterium]
SLTLEQQETEAITANQKKLEEARNEETEKLNKVAELDLEVEKLLQRQGFEQQNLDRVDSELSRHQEEKNEIVEGINSGETDIQIKKENIEEIRKTIEASHTTKSDTQEKLDQAVTKRDELNAKQKNFFEERDKLSKQINDLDKEIFRLKSQKERAEESMASQSSYMWQEYEITLHDAQNMRNEELNDLPAMKKEITSLKDKIKRLGDVNVNAIEDYKNVMERYTFLHKQHSDLVEAEKGLQEIIVNLDELMRKQFRERFAEIDHEFDKVFKELFGGGQANLELMDDDDILEAGIKIIAQPPGKKLQNMMQLSGGEKALTAISLLFAIQNLKPSPFCLLDEIEAALDESNVDRFAKYLHKMTKSTQFIVITHRRGTMDQANQLYGITMQEKGVSTLVSVDLQKGEQ